MITIKEILLTVQIIILFFSSNNMILGEENAGTFKNARVKLYKSQSDKPSDTLTINGIIDNQLLNDEYEKIEIVNQGISVLRTNAIRDIITKQLILTDNGIQDMEEDAFVDLEAIKVLDLSNNLLTHIKKNTVSKIITLDRLILNNNRISIIDKLAFKNMQFNDLQLENNELTNYDPEWFHRNNENLYTINLKGNKITHIPKDSFKYFKRINSILLQENCITNIHKEAFLGVHSLGTLDISSNQLKNLDPNLFRTFNGIAAENEDARRFSQIPSMHVDSFKSFTGINTLDIHNNSFTYLPKKLLRDVKHNLRYIFIQDNPWQCACYRDIEKWGSKGSQRGTIRINNFNMGYFHNDDPICMPYAENTDKCVEKDIPGWHEKYSNNSITGEAYYRMYIAFKFGA